MTVLLIKLSATRESFKIVSMCNVYFDIFEHRRKRDLPLQNDIFLFFFICRPWTRPVKVQLLALDMHQKIIRSARIRPGSVTEIDVTVPIERGRFICMKFH